MSTEQCKNLLRIAKEFIKLNYFIKANYLSQPTISRFINEDDYEIIGNNTLNILVDEIYNACTLYVDCYDDLKKIV